LQSGIWETVRKREQFGQIVEWNLGNGPKKRTIRTDCRVKSGKRSEKERNSDRLQSGIWETVRKRVEFGQIAEWNQENGPKKRGIRTDCTVESGKRSEKERNSDRLQSGIWETVRKRVEFGQIAEWNRETVRKREQFGQIAEWNQENGPKERGIRTDCSPRPLRSGYTNVISNINFV